ncbi:MAG: LLM class flavin-dependent oxidoreductase [Microthrixaceae bacterium]
MFTLRFDMRSPAFAAPTTELYRSALQMSEWADDHGCAMVVLSEHHGSTDGYLPSPLVMASAISARTRRVPISVMVAILPLYDPVRLAEEMCVIDHISEGRVSYVAGLGYRPEEYEMFGVEFSSRGALAEEGLQMLLAAVSGRPFLRDGHEVSVTPAPRTAGGPGVAWGGGSIAAARRAGRHGLDLIAQRGVPGMREAYESAAREAGHEPGTCFLPPPDMPTAVFVSDDPDRAWDELGPHLMHDVRSYALWNETEQQSASMSRAAGLDELRAESRSHRIVTTAEARAMVERGEVLQLHPLIGGLPPEVAWRYLRTAVEAASQ